MKEVDLIKLVEHSLVAGSLSGCAVDLSLYPIDTIKTRLQEKKNFNRLNLFKSLYSGVGSVLIGSGPSSALFFTVYNLTKETIHFSSQWKIHIIGATAGEFCACLIRVPVEVIKQRAQVNRNLRLSTIARTTLQNEVGLDVCFSSNEIFSPYVSKGFLGLYRGYFATISREIPFSIIQFPLWELFKDYWKGEQGHSLSPWQGAICGSIAGGIAASITTPFDVAKTRIMLAHHEDLDAVSHSFRVMKSIAKTEGLTALYNGVLPRTMWMSIGGLIYFGAFEFVTSLFFPNNT